MTESERQSELDAAVHSGAMEGLSVSEETLELARRWARGEITADELVEMTRERHGLDG